MGILLYGISIRMVDRTDTIRRCPFVLSVLWLLEEKLFTGFIFCSVLCNSYDKRIYSFYDGTVNLEYNDLTISAEMPVLLFLF